MSRFGTFLLGATEFLRRLVGGSRVVACLGDSSSHGGTIISSGQDGTASAAGTVMAVTGAMHSCPKKDHGVTSITAIITKTRINGKLIVTSGAKAGCGAVMNPPDRKVYAG